MNHFIYLFLMLSFLLFFLSSSDAQNLRNCNCHDRLTNLAMYYAAKGESKKALHTYQQGMDFKPKSRWAPFEYYMISEFQARNGMYQESVNNLISALKMGYDAGFIDENHFESVRKSEHWDPAMDKLDSLKREYSRHLNLEYRLAIEDIRGSDQTIRRLIRVPDSVYQQLDTLNFGRIKKLINKYGYPNVEQHGFDGSQGVYLVLLHASMYSENLYQEILDILNQAITEFSYKKSNLAQFMDRRMVWYHQKHQQYGTWNSYRAKEFKPLASLEKLDAKRFEYNLLRLKEVSVKENRVLPEGYKAGTYPANYFCGHTFEE